MKTITAQHAKVLVDRGATLIDVREPDEHAREKIAGARNVPLSRLPDAGLGGGPGQIVVFHCKSGMRTAGAAGNLSTALADGCEGYIVEGGIEAWKSAGLPVLRDVGRPIELQRQVQIVAGLIVLAGTLLGLFVAPGFLAIPAFIGAGLTFAGLTGFCGMAKVLLLAPWNRGAAQAS